MKIIENDNDQQIITGNNKGKTKSIIKEDKFENFNDYETEKLLSEIDDYYNKIVKEAEKEAGIKKENTFEDVSSYSDEEIKIQDEENEEFIIEETEIEEKEEKGIWKNKKKRANIAYSFITVLLVIIGAAYGVLNAVLDNVQAEEPEKEQEEIVEKVYDEEDFDLYSAVGTASSLNNYVYQWYDTGESMSSKNVINVLLLGLDSSDGLKNGGRSDTMMLVSLNKKTEKISMISFFRDTWVYFKTPSGGEYYSKMNASYFYGGAECAVQTIEKVFKIKIDHYVTVDFSSFQDIVDAVGGVRVDVQEYESKNMMREWKLECPVGENVLLNGKQAFYFARQRHSDANGDVSRTRRQRQVITAFIESCKGASLSQLTDALNKVFKYVRTDLTKNDILNYATRALSGGWLNYEIESFSISEPEVFKTPTIKGTSLVVIDYPVVAKMVQEAIYGNTNIVIDENRVKVFNLY